MRNPGTFKIALLAAIAEALPVYPLLLVLSVYVIETSPYLLWGMYALSLLAGGIAGLRLRREPAYLAALALPVLLAVAAALTPSGLSAGPIFCLLILLSIAGMRGVYLELRVPPSSRAETLTAAAWLVAGAVVYRIAGGSALLGDYTFSVYLSCASTLALMLLRWNTRRVRESQGLAATEAMPSNPLLYANRGLTAVLLLLILAVGLLLPSSNPFAGWPRSQEPRSLPAVSDRSVKESDLTSVCAILYAQAKERAEKKGQTLSDDQLPPECRFTLQDAGNETDDGHYGWIGWVAAAFMAAAVLAVAYYVLRILYVVFAEWLPDWLKRLLANLRITAGLRSREEEEAYLDTTEKIHPRGSKAPTAPAVFAEPAEGPRRDYFRLIREAIRRGYSFRPGLTPSETGRDLASQPAYRELDEAQVERLIERYNRTRYAEKGRGEQDR